MWIIFKVFIEFVTIVLLFVKFCFFWPKGMWGLSSLTKDGICTTCVGKQDLNPWTTREVPPIILDKGLWTCIIASILEMTKMRDGEGGSSPVFHTV